MLDNIPISLHLLLDFRISDNIHIGLPLEDLGTVLVVVVEKVVTMVEVSLIQNRCDNGVVMTNNLTSPVSSSQFPQTHIATGSTIHDSTWYLDSGATHHTTPNSPALTSKSAYTGPGGLQVGNGTSLPISHIGNSVVSGIFVTIEHRLPL